MTPRFRLFSVTLEVTAPVTLPDERAQELTDVFDNITRGMHDRFAEQLARYDCDLVTSLRT